MDVAHDHHIGCVPKDAAQPLDLAAVPQVLGSEGVPELVRVDSEANPSAGPLKKVGDALNVHGSAISEQQKVRAGAVGSHSVHVAQELTAQSAAHRDAAELRTLPAADLEENSLPVLLHVLQLKGTELAEPHPSAKQDLGGQGGPSGGHRLEKSLELGI